MYTRFADVRAHLREAARRHAVDVGAGLAHSTPAAEGIDAGALAALVAAAEKSRSSALVLLANGKLVGQWYFGGATRRIESMSGTKSMVQLAVALLLQEGRIASLDQPVAQFFPERADWQTGDKARVTIRMLLNHTSGLFGEVTTTDIYATADFVAYSLATELTSAPGTHFFYNNRGANLLSGIVERAAGQPLDDYLRARLFKPLGIRDVSWSHDLAGHAVGMSGMQIHPLDWAKIGQLLLDGGVGQGRQIISSALLSEATKPSQPYRATYGLLWWLKYDEATAPEAARIPYGFCAEGYLGQYLLVLPRQKLVAVRMADGQQPSGASDDDFDFVTLVHALKK